MSRNQVFEQAERLAKSRSITFSAACAVIARRKPKKTKVQIRASALLVAGKGGRTVKPRIRYATEQPNRDYNHAALGFAISALGSVAMVAAFVWMICKLSN